MQPGMDTPTVDNAEMVYISSLALLKVMESWVLIRFPYWWKCLFYFGAVFRCWNMVCRMATCIFGNMASDSFFLWRIGRAGVPMEVMGLMLGEFVDDYTVRVIDVFAMPQSGTGVSVEAVDPVFQTKMLDMLKQTGR